MRPRIRREDAGHDGEAAEDVGPDRILDRRGGPDRGGGRADERRDVPLFLVYRSLLQLG